MTTSNWNPNLVALVIGAIGLVFLAAIAPSRPPEATKGANGLAHATADSFQQKVLQAKTPVLVDFYADWCGPCKALAPILHEFAAENPGATIVKVNVDQEPELARRYKISSIPSLIVFQEGRPVAKHSGMASKATLARLLPKQSGGIGEGIERRIQEE